MTCPLDVPWCMDGGRGQGNSYCVLWTSVEVYTLYMTLSCSRREKPRGAPVRDREHYISGCCCVLLLINNAPAASAFGGSA